MNLNELAKEISKLEGGKKQVSIAQIKEILKCISIELYWDWGDNTVCGEMDAEHFKQTLVSKLIKNGKKWAGRNE